MRDETRRQCNDDRGRDRQRQSAAERRDNDRKGGEYTAGACRQRSVSCRRHDDSSGYDDSGRDGLRGSSKSRQGDRDSARGSRNDGSSDDSCGRRRKRGSSRGSRESRRKEDYSSDRRDNDRRHSRFQVMKPPKFDGRGSLDEFVMAFENCADFNQWTERDKAAYLRNSLAGNAAQFLRDSARDTYSELVRKLDQRYGTKNQQERYRAEIRSRRRRKDEPVTELAESIRGLIRLAYPGDLSNETNTVLARDAFLTALNDTDLEESIRRLEPKDLDQACQMALRLEVIHNAVHTNPTGQRAHQVRQVDRSSENRSTKVSEPPETAERESLVKQQITKYVDKMAQEMEEMGRAVERKECTETVRNLVPSGMVPPDRQVTDSTAQQRAPRRGNNRGQCFNCGQDDHWRRDCPHPPRARRDPNGQHAGQGSSGQPAEGRQVQSNRAVASGRNGATSGYLEARIDGRPVQCVVDTGSETSIFPSVKSPRPRPLLPSSLRPIPMPGRSPI